jgi:hypothetical protein
MSWAAGVEKFERLAVPFTDSSGRASIVRAIKDLEAVPIPEFMKMLGSVGRGRSEAERSTRRAHGN